MLFQVLGEFILQILVEAASDLGLHIFRRDGLRFKNPIFSEIGFFAWGLIAGALSLWPFPTGFIASPGLRLANLVITPLVAGGVMMLFGKLRSRRGHELAALERLGYAHAFAFGMALIRFVFAK